MTKPRVATGVLVGLAGSVLALTAPAPAARAQPAPTTPTGPPAQSAPPAAPAPSPPASVTPITPAATRDGPGITARGLARIAMIDARIPQDVGPADFGVAAELLTVAASLAPNDTELLRLLIEAREAAGDEAEAAALRRRLIALDPADAVTTLSVIADRIGRLQDVDARLAAYEQILGDRGNTMDESIRSRLALDAAALLRERGDATGFAEHLRLALKLDPTNKDAAALLYKFVASGEATVAQRLEALALLLLADPADGQTHVQIAGELAAAGAYAQARRFYQLASDLASLLDGAKDPDVETALEVVRWRLDGPAATAKRIDDLIRKPREDLSRRLAALAAQQADPAAKAPPPPSDPLPKPEDIRLPSQIERVFALSASAAGDTTLTERAVGELRESLRRAEELVVNPAARAQGMTEEAARTDLPERRLEFAWCALLANQMIPDAGTATDQLIQGGTLKDTARLTLEGWLSLRTGVTAAAEPKLREAASASPAAQLGLAVLAEERGDKAGALEGYRAVAAAVPDGPMGAWAGSAFQRLGGQPLPAPEGSAALTALAAGVPRWVDDLVRDPRRMVRLAVSLSEQTMGATDRLGLKVRVRNTSPAPMAVGPDLPIDSRVLIAPKIEVGTSPMGNALPNVTTLARRLRLKPGEEFETDLWPDGGISGWFMELGAGQAVRANYRVLQGFRPRDAGGYDVGPMGLGAESGTVSRAPFPHANAPMPAILAALKVAPVEQLPNLLGVVRFRLYRDHRGFERLPGELRQDVIASLVAAYASGSPEARLLMLAMLPTGQFIASLTPFDEAALAQADADPRVTIVALLTRARGADLPALAAAAQSPDASIQRAAQRAGARLADADRRTYSRLSGGVAAEVLEPTKPGDAAAGPTPGAR